MAGRGVVVAFTCASLTFTSSAASAAEGAHQQVNPWGVLAALTPGASAVVMCGSAPSTAANTGQTQQDRNGCVLPVMDVPTSAPVEAHAANGLAPLLVGLIAIASATGIYFAFNSANSRFDAGSQPNSPP